MSRAWLAAVTVLTLFEMACNSDAPVPATTGRLASGVTVTVTRVATHPFLARFNLNLKVTGPGRCTASTDLFPDTGGASRRNVYMGSAGLIYVVGQYDARAFDLGSCSVALREFRALEKDMLFVGAFDVNEHNEWTFFSAGVRPERLFEPR